MKLHAENIAKSYKGRKVVKDVSFEVNQGEIVGLLGPNGAGKTTSFYMVVGLVSPDNGSVSLSDTKITGLAMYKRAKLGIGYLPQEASIFRDLSVEDNIKAILEFTPLKKKEQKERLEELLSEFGLQHVRKSMGKVLSGGERRRTEIARSLATDPKFILLDEPFAGIDPIAVEDIQKIVLKLKQRNIGVLITDHNVQETLSITDRAYLLFEGSILKAGSAEELAEDEQVRKVYLGENFELRNTKLKEKSMQSDLISAINRIVNQAQLLITKQNPSPEDFEQFGRYNTEMITYFLNHCAEDDKLLFEAIPELKFKTKEGSWIGMIADTMTPGFGTYFKEKRNIEIGLEKVKEIKEYYSNLEFKLKNPHEIN